MNGANIVRLEIDGTYGGVYAGSSFEISRPVAEHFNEAAMAADHVLDNEYRPFVPGEYFTIACPMARSWPRGEFVHAYHRLHVRLDEQLELRLGDYPRLFSNVATDLAQIRAVPTYIPKTSMPDGFFGKPHLVELLQNGDTLFGPAQRFFHTTTSGHVFSQLEDGVGRLVAEIDGNMAGLAERGQIVFFTDPTFGEPIGATQVHDDGSTMALPYHLLGKDCVGDTFLFNEGVITGIVPRGDRVVVELQVPNRGTGLAAVLYGGHTRDLAFRVDATVL